MLTKSEAFPMWRPYHLRDLRTTAINSCTCSTTTSKPEPMKSHGQSIALGTLQFSTRPEAVKISQWLHDAWKTTFAVWDSNWLCSGNAWVVELNELWIKRLWVMRQTNKSFTCTWQHRLLKMKTFKIFGQDIEVDRFPYKSTQVDIGSPS